MSDRPLTDDEVFGPAPGPQQKPQTGGLTDADVFGEQDDAVRTTLRATTRVNAGRDPALVAEAERLAAKYGLPTGTAERRIDDLREQETMARMDQFATESPKVAEWMASDPDAAALAKDDIEGLRALEQGFSHSFLAGVTSSAAGLLRRQADLGRSVVAGVVGGVGAATSGAGEALNMAGRNIRRAQDSAASMGEGFWRLFSEDLGDSYAANYQAMRDILPDWVEDPFGAVGGGIRSAGSAVEGFAQETIAVDESRQNLATDIASGLGSLGPYLAAAYFTGGAGVLGLGATQGIDTQADRAEDAGTYGTASSDTAQALGATVTAVTERMGLGFLMRRLPEPAKAALNKRVADILLAGAGEAGQEMTESVMQDAITKALVDDSFDMFQGLSREGLAAFGVGVLFRGGVHVARAQQDADMAVQEAETLEQIDKAIGGLKLTELSPERLREVLARLKNSSISDVYMPVDRFRELFQSDDQLRDSLEPLGVDSAELTSAALSNGQVRLPIEGFFTALTPEQRSAAKKSARLTPGGMPLDEAVNFDRDQALRDFIEATGEQGRPADDPTNWIYEFARNQIESAGATPDVAEKQAELFASYFRTAVVRSGVSLDQLAGTPEDPRFTIRRDMPESVQRVADARNTDAVVDGAIEALRSGRLFSDREVNGQRLVELIRSQGGIDPGAFGAGDLRAQDAQRRGLLRQGGMTVERALDIAQENGFLQPQEGGYDINAVLDLLIGDLGQTPAFSPEGFNVDRAAFNESTNELGRILEDLGIGREQLQSMDNAAVRRALGMDRQAGEGGTEMEQGRGDPRELFQGAMQSQPDAPPAGKELVAIHNLSAENLLFADKLGGLAVPSIGITKAETQFGGFGDITLIGSKDLATPAGDNPVFSADAYTQRFPDLVWAKVPSKKANEFVESFGEAYRERDTGQFWDYLVNTPDRDRAIDEAQRSATMMRAWLKEQGEEPAARVMQERRPPQRAPWAGRPEFTEKLAELEARGVDIPSLRDDSPEWAEVSEAAMRAVEAEVQTYAEIDPALGEQLRGDMLRWFDNGSLTFGPGNSAITFYLSRNEPANEDLYATRRALDSQIGDDRMPEFKQWAAEKIAALFDPPKIMLGKRKVEMTLANVVEAMTASRKVAGKEKTMTFSSGQVKAANAKQFQTLKEIKANRDLIVSPEEEKGAVEASQKLLQQYRMAALEFFTQKNWRGDVDTWAGLDASMKALADAAKKAATPANVRAALQKNGFRGMDAETIELGVQALQSVRQTVVDYFEAKPQRAVSLSEFAGAVIPSNAPQEVRDALARAGVKVAEYDRADNDARRATVARFSRELNEQRGDVLFQTLDDTKRGSINIVPGYPGGFDRYIITLGNKADKSTFLHESAHMFLELRRQVNAQVAAIPETDRTADQQRIVDDDARLLEWLGVDNLDQLAMRKGDDAHNARARKAHEKFAESFEAYLEEGKAPSPRLKRAFQSFKTWLGNIYSLFKNALQNAELTPEVRAYFDRMLAVDEEIDAVRQDLGMLPLLSEAEKGDMSDEEFKRYQLAVQTARQSAIEQEGAVQFTYAKREAERAKSAEMKELRAQVEKDLNDDPAWRAIFVLRRGTMPDGSPLPEGERAFKLDTRALTDMQGKEWVKKNMSGMHTKDGGVHPDMAASVLGFKSTVEMLNAIASKPSKKDAIEAEALRRWQERNPDPMLDGELDARVTRALNSDAAEEVMVREINALFGGRKLALPPLRDYVGRVVSEKSVKDLSPHRHKQVEMRESRKAAIALGKGDKLAAAQARRNALMARLHYRAETDAKERAEAFRDEGMRLAKKPAQERLARAGWEGYLDKVNQVLASFDLRRMSVKDLERRKSLRTWVEAQQDAGEITAVSEELIARVESERVTNWREAKVAEIDAAMDALKNIQHLAKIKNKLTAARDGREWDEARTDLLARMLDSLPETVGGEVSRRDVGDVEAARRGVVGALANLNRPENVIEALDGGETGPWHDYVWTVMQDAENKAVDYRKALGTKLKALRAETPEAFSTLQDKVTILGGKLTVSRATLLGIALNTGNASNLQRLMDGGIVDGSRRVKLNPDEVKQILSELRADELQFVQGMWDAVDSLWPDIVNLQRRMSGLPPEKVDPQEASIVSKDGKTVTLRGGYWPLVYDANRSTAGETQDGADAMRLMMGAGFTRAFTPKGYQKARVESFESPLQLDFASVMSRHMDHVITDLSHREAVRDINRILSDNEIKEQLILRVGREGYDNLRGSLSYAVSASSAVAGRVAARWARALDTLLTNTSVAALAIRPDIALGNLTSATIQGLDRVGVKALMRGWWALETSRTKTTEAIVSKSGFMAQRLNETDFQFQQELARLAGERGWGPAYRRMMMTLHRAADAEVTRALWWGRYQQALDAGESKSAAVLSADKAVRQTQTASGRKDVSTFERDSQFKQARQFMGPMFVIFGRLYAMARGEGATQRVGARASTLMIQVFMAPAIFALAAGRGPEDGDDDEEIGTGDWARWLAVNVGLFPLMTLPYLRDLTAIGEAAITDKPVNPRAAPTTQAVIQMGRAFQSMGDNVGTYMETGEIDYLDATRDIFSILGPIVGAPSSQVRITSQTVEAVLDDPEKDKTELAKMAVYGPPRE